MKARLATEIGTRISLRIYWDGQCKKGSYHNAMKFLFDVLQSVKDGIYGGSEEDYPEEAWPTHCSDCGCEVPKENIKKQVFNKRLYDTPDGTLHEGDLFWADWYPENMYWDNHKGPMLMAMLPNGGQWNIDSRASNCAKPNDRTHRCWIRHGEPPNIHVDTNGNWCGAGGGSIGYGTPGEPTYYHGFLHNGEFKQC